MYAGLKNGFTEHYRELIIAVASATLSGQLVERISQIENELCTEGKETNLKESLEKDRSVDRLRLKTLLGYGLGNDTGSDVDLESTARCALSRTEKEYVPLVAVGKEICHKCHGRKYIVTNSCEGCIARPCIFNCPKQCISRVDGKAQIDQSRCIRCGTCARVCPYNAIHNQTIPCEDACPVDAISKDSDGNSVINFNRCIHCGKCMVRCPFGAILMPSQIVDVCKNIHDRSRPVVAMLAPAILAQFSATPTQLRHALLAAGFADVVEVAAGADVTSLMEAEEFLSHVVTGDQPLMTTSCCPSFYQAVHIHVPALTPFVSHTGSPMHYTAELVRRRSPSAITVFVGPCVAKRAEGLRRPNVDCVLTAEELHCIFRACHITPADMPKDDSPAPPLSRPASREGTYYAVRAGVASAVQAAVSKAHARLLQNGGRHIDEFVGPIDQLGSAVMDRCSVRERPGLQQQTSQDKPAEKQSPTSATASQAAPHAPSSSTSSAVTPASFSSASHPPSGADIHPVYISPLDRKAVAQLKKWGENPSSCPYNLIECMACDGGCVGGPGALVQMTMGTTRMKTLLPQRPHFDDIEDVLTLEVS